MSELIADREKTREVGESLKGVEGGREGGKGRRGEHEGRVCCLSPHVQLDIRGISVLDRPRARIGARATAGNPTRFNSDATVDRVEAPPPPGAFDRPPEVHLSGTGPAPACQPNKGGSSDVCLVPVDKASQGRLVLRGWTLCPRNQMLATARALPHSLTEVSSQKKTRAYAQGNSMRPEAQPPSNCRRLKPQDSLARPATTLGPLERP
jgi:hypothetical protein